MTDSLEKIEEEVNDSLEEETSELSFLSKWVDMQLIPRITSTLPTSRTASTGCSTRSACRTSKRSLRCSMTCLTVRMRMTLTV